MTVDDKFRELYEARNDHETRLGIAENDIKFMRSQIRENHIEYMNGVKEIQGTINKFIEDINGIPKHNASEIKQIKEERCKPMIDKIDTIRKVNWMLLGMGVVFAVVIIPIAIDVLPKFFNK